MRRTLLLFAFLVCFPLAANAQQFGITSFVTPFMEPSAAGQVYPAPPNVGLIANRPTFCSATGQEYYATDAIPAAILYYATVAGTSCTWTAVGGPGASGAVSSVFTRIGAVVAADGDYTCMQVTNCNQLPSGTDSGTANAYVITTTPTISSLAYGTSFTFTVANGNTGASTLNVDGLGAQGLTTILRNALPSGALSTGLTYQATYDGTDFLLAGSYASGVGAVVNPGGSLNLAGAYIIAQPSTNSSATNSIGSSALVLMSPPGNSASGPNSRQMLTFLCVPLGGSGCGGSGNTQVSFGFDKDNVLNISGGAELAFQTEIETFSEIADNNQGTGDDFVVSPNSGTPTAGACGVRQNVNLSATKFHCWDKTDGLDTANAAKTFVTTDFTDSNSGSLVAITGLSWTLPTGAANLSFHCSFMFDQTSAAVSDAFGIGVITTAPTQVNANGTSFSGTAGAPTSGVLTGLTTTTPTAVVTFTPSAITTIWNAQMDGTVEWPGNATPGVLNFYVSTTTGADNFIVKRGSYCTLF